MIQIDMEKPNHCLHCPMCNGDDNCVLIQEIDPSWDWEEQYANCPLQEVEPERKKGKWLVYGDIPTTCSCCHEDWNKYVNGDVWYSDELPKYCPNCGSYNRGEEE